MLLKDMKVNQVLLLCGIKETKKDKEWVGVGADTRAEADWGTTVSMLLIPHAHLFPPSAAPLFPCTIRFLFKCRVFNHPGQLGFCTSSSHHKPNSDIFLVLFKEDQKYHISLLCILIASLSVFVSQFGLLAKIS